MLFFYLNTDLFALMLVSDGCGCCRNNINNNYSDLCLRNQAELHDWNCFKLCCYYSLSSNITEGANFV